LRIKTKKIFFPSNYQTLEDDLEKFAAGNLEVVGKFVFVEFQKN